jgi:UPF0176 protein
MSSDLPVAPVPPVPPVLMHAAFYRFAPLDEPLQVAEVLRDLLDQPPLKGLGGSILLAPEGINGAIAGPTDAVRAFERLLRVPSLRAFEGMPLRLSACRTLPFARMKVHVRREIVQLGVGEVDARRSGIDVSPHDWQSLIRQDDVVLLDNRNSFEFQLGHFHGAIDPQVTNFRAFPAYVRAHAPTWRAQGKRVAMYCTGGIRCEKTSAWMRTLELPVYQLQGGILNYFATMEDARRDFVGECFVFDNRVALDTRLQETATTVDDVYRHAPQDAWRLLRARRLAEAAA